MKKRKTTLEERNLHCKKTVLTMTGIMGQWP